MIPTCLFFREKIGLRIRALRKEAGLSQEGLALKAGIDRTYINSIENGGQLVETVWGVGYKLNVNGYIAKALIA